MSLLKAILVFTFLVSGNFLSGQNYQAIHGSSYAGSLGTGANPSSIVHVPYAWDITPLSMQFKQSTNAYKIEKYSFLSSPSQAEASPTESTKKRFAFANQDIHLLNTRISLNSKHAIAFGANIRSYLHGTIATSNWQDTVFTLNDFMDINLDNRPLSGDMAGTAWAELYATYARTIIDAGDWIVNGGITVKVNRGLAGGYAKASNLSYQPEPAGPGYLLSTGRVQYGYSANFDAIDSNKSSAENRRNFLDKTFSRLGADIGIEYIRLAGENEGEGGDYAYETKLGISLLDVGGTRYIHGSRSRVATAGKPGVLDTIIEQRFSNVNSFDDFNDSLSEISGSFTRLNGEFHIYQPARILINLDQHLVNNFFLNAEISIPVFPILAKNALYIKDMNLLAITPRWELKAMGAYLPLVVNTRGQVWLGGAVKAGPILFGAHSLANLFSKNKAQAGGLYLAFTIRPGKLYDRQAHYPKDRLSRQERKNLYCPKF